MSLHLTLIDTHEKLSALKPEWDALAGENPFLSWDWAETWWRHYQSPQTKLFTLAVRDDAHRLVGIAPWILRNSLSRGRVIRFIGSNEVCGDRLRILTQLGYERSVMQEISNWLATDARREWDLVELTGVEQSNADIGTLTNLLGSRGNQIHVQQDLNCWKIELPSSWEDYLMTLFRSRRNRTRRMLKNVVDAGLGEQCVATSPEEFELGFDVLIDLHQKRRNELGEPGCFASDRYHSFHYEFAARMLRQNRLRLCWLELAGRPAAVEYSILGTETIYNYQSGFEPALAAEHPGWLNLAMTLRWAIGAGFKSFDMLRGDESYKASFGARPDRLVQVRIVGHQNSARLRHAAWCTQAKFKRWAREGLKFASDLRKRPCAATNIVEPAEATKP